MELKSCNYIKIAVCHVLLILGFICNIHAQNSNFDKYETIYVIRHAEKDTGNDPLLNKKGNQRSGDLQRLFKDNAMPERIYVSQFRRTRHTADSLRLHFKIDTTHYIADNTGDDLFSAITKNDKNDKRILIIGHSNTIPTILQRLGISDFPSVNIRDDAYDNFYTVSIKNGKAVLLLRKYGSPSFLKNLQRG